MVKRVLVGLLDGTDVTIRTQLLVLVLFSCYGMALSQTVTNGAASPSPDTAGGREKNPIKNPRANKQTVIVKRLEHPPVIDGRLDEDEWRQAVVLTDFYQAQPGDNGKPSHPTEVFLAYDNKFLYFGIRAVDKPGEVRATSRCHTFFAVDYKT